jgi:hypothetical protein
MPLRWRFWTVYTEFLQPSPNLILFDWEINLLISKGYPLWIPIIWCQWLPWANLVVDVKILVAIVGLVLFMIG